MRASSWKHVEPIKKDYWERVHNSNPTHADRECHEEILKLRIKHWNCKKPQSIFQKPMISWVDPNPDSKWKYSQKKSAIKTTNYIREHFRNAIKRQTKFNHKKNIIQSTNGSILKFTETKFANSNIEF